MEIKPTKSGTMGMLIVRYQSRGGLPPGFVEYWADEFEVSDEIVQRCVLATLAHLSWREATWKRVNEMPTPPGEDYTEKFVRHLHVDNEITREYKAAAAALDENPDPPPSRDPVTGEYTERKLRVMAKRKGVSYEVMLRFYRAHAAYLLYKCSLKEYGRNEYLENFKAPFDRIRDGLPENEITREYEEANAALQAGAHASTVTPPPPDRDPTARP